MAEAIDPSAWGAVPADGGFDPAAHGAVPLSESTTPIQQLNTDFSNQLDAAGQGTTPVISAQKPNLVSDQVSVDEAGNVGYKDPNGQFVPTDNKTQVVLRDPSDNQLKVFARTDDTNEGAASSLGRMISMGMGAGPIDVTKAAIPAVQAADRIGVSVPAAIASDSPMVRYGSQVLAKAPGGSPIVDAVNKSVGDLKGAVGNAVDLTGGAADPAAAGTNFVTAIGDSFKPAVKARTGAAYDAVTDLVDPDKLTPLSATQGAVADIVARRQASGEDTAGKAVQSVLGGATRPGGLTFEGIKNLRTRVGEMLDTGMFPEGMSQGELKQVYGSLSDDLKNAAQNAGGDAAVTALDRAGQIHSKFQDWKDKLAPIIGGDAKSGESVTQAIIRKAQNGASADVNGLMLARAAVPKEIWQDVAATAVSKLGTNRTGEWSPSAFLSDYRNLTDGGKKMLFGAVGSGKVIPYLDDIADVSKKFVSAGKLANTSGTAGHNVAFMLGGSALTGLAHGSIVEPVVAASGVLGINVMARVLARPATAASMAQWARSYSRVVENPGPATIAGFDRASRNFANTTNSVLGTNADPSSLLRSIQAPAQGSADPNQPEVPRVPTQ